MLGKNRKGRVTDYSLKIGDYVVNYDATVKTAKVSTTDTEPTTKPEGTSDLTSYKKIVYLDLTDLSKICIEADVLANVAEEVIKFL